MQQILPNLPCLDELIDVPIRRHQNTDINLEAPHASHTPHLATVQHLQELALHLGRHVSELIEKERAAIGELEQARLVLHRAGKGAPFMTKQLTLEELRSDCPTVDIEKR